jgi:hypothetical protein
MAMSAAAPRRALRRLARGVPAGQVTAMAKGQQKSNREIKKPKKEKAKPVNEPSPLTARLTASQDKGKSGRK